MGDNRQVCPKCQKLSAGLYCRYCGYPKSIKERAALEAGFVRPTMSPTPAPQNNPRVPLNMEFVAQSFGVKLNEKFNLTLPNETAPHPDSPFFFDENGLWDTRGQPASFKVAAAVALAPGKLTISKVKWVPKVGESYWYVTNEGTPTSRKHQDATVDSLLVMTGNYYEKLEHISKEVKTYWTNFFTSNKELIIKES